MENDFHQDIEKAMDTLREGIILYPSDTIWGIGCDATNEVAILNIYSLKKREEKKSMIILVSDEEMIKEYVDKPSSKLLEFVSSQKNPTTGIFTGARNLPDALVNEDGTIAIRIARDTFCQDLIRTLNKPLVSTSANISGEPYPKNFSEVDPQIKNGVDYIVQHRQQEKTMFTPSSIVRLDKNGEIEKLR